MDLVCGDDILQTALSILIHIIIGYDTQNLPAIKAFKHFIQEVDSSFKSKYK
jgi:hypothetical protein